MESVNEPGRYKFQLCEWGPRESNTSKSQAFSYEAIALGRDDGTGTFLPIPGDPVKSSGDIWFIAKNGVVRDLEVQFLRNWLKWDGKAATLYIPIGEPGAHAPVEFIGIVEKDAYQTEKKGVPVFRIDRIEGDRPAFATLPPARRATLAEKLQAALDGRTLPVEPGGEAPPEPPQEVPF